MASHSCRVNLFHPYLALLHQAAGLIALVHNYQAVAHKAGPVRCGLLVTDLQKHGQNADAQCAGILYAKYKEEKLMEPGKVYPFTIKLYPTSNVFKKGHRIRLEIANSDSPLTDGIFSHPYHPTQIGSDTIHHDAVHASCLLLPVVART